jgi:O-antigen ligase
MTGASANARGRVYLVSTLLAVYATLIALAPAPAMRLYLAAPLLAVPFALWVLSAAPRWIFVFLLCALLLPPLAIDLGDSGPHVSLFIALLGVVAGILRMADWRLRAEPSHVGISAYLFAMAASVAPAAVYSGPGIAAASLARVLLFGISVYVFFYAAYGPGSYGVNYSMRTVRAVYWAAVGSALFACIDFYFQFPAPAGFGAQYVWMDSGVYRRAQGLFYEASTLGNVCAFFLLMTAAALSDSGAGNNRPLPVSRLGLIAGGAVFASALVMSFSRASLINLFVSLAALVLLRRRRTGAKRLIVLPSLILSAGALASYISFPRLTAFYWERASASVSYFFSATEGILSGRLESWRILRDFLIEKPFHAIFGVGYKTLPYSDFIGQTVVADNAYLSSLVETGVIGLAAMLLFCAAVLRIAYRAARHQNASVAFLGACFFCFWIGEMVQMMSGDLLTYWRVLPVYMWVLGLAARHAADESSTPRPVQ